MHGPFRSGRWPGWRRGHPSAEWSARKSSIEGAPNRDACRASISRPRRKLGVRSQRDLLAALADSRPTGRPRFYRDVRAAAAFLEAAFGFAEKVRIGDTHRAQMRVGADGAVVVADDGGDRSAVVPNVVTHEIKLGVNDIDAAFVRARQAGAVVRQEPVSHPYGERAGVVEDTGRWTLTTG